MILKKLIKNPLLVWLSRTYKSIIIEKKYKIHNLKIGYMSTADQCLFGNYNTIYENVNLHMCSLGDMTYISKNTNISRAKIGKYCSIGPNCSIGLGMHPSAEFVSTHPAFFSTVKQSQISFADKSYFNEYEEISIGNDVWIGANVVIIDGCEIGDGAVIASGAIVTKNVPPYAIVGGVPAKVIKFRFSDDEIQSLLEDKWWNKDFEFIRNNYLKFHSIKKYLSN